MNTSMLWTMNTMKPSLSLVHIPPYVFLRVNICLWMFPNTSCLLLVLCNLVTVVKAC